MLPTDPVILLSYINTQLRDHYDSLEDLCKSLIVDKDSLINTLNTIDYKYDSEQNQFI